MTTTRYLIIDKVNEVYLKIEAEADIRRELGEYFTFEVPGFKFMPAYQNRVWDGRLDYSLMRLVKYMLVFILT